jgi:hypothetical protein
MSKLYKMNKSVYIGGGVLGEIDTFHEISDPTYLLAKNTVREATPEEVAEWNKAKGIEAPKEPEAKKEAEPVNVEPVPDKPKEPKAKKVKVPYSDLVKEAKALGIKVKGNSETLTKAIAAKKKELKK